LRRRLPGTTARVRPRASGATVADEAFAVSTSGIPSDNDAFIRLLGESFSQDTMNLDELRAWLVGKWSNQPLVAKPGTTFAYSNLGYTTAGAMIERAAKTTWEEMIVERIFTPLSLGTAGIGPPGERRMRRRSMEA
jgi:CubicO group peptidase (beta-lactamase class C family)